MQKKMYRQGDILLVRVGMPEATLKPVPKDEGRVILAYGEVTGHAHVAECAEGGVAELLETEEGRRFLKLVDPGVVVHDEHAPIDLEPGYYEVRRQREYTPEYNRYVAD